MTKEMTKFGEADVIVQPNGVTVKLVLAASASQFIKDRQAADTAIPFKSKYNQTDMEKVMDRAKLLGWF